MGPRVRLQLASWIATGLLGLFPAQAADYYVSPSGSDSAPGTLAQPFQTIQKAASVMVAGDTAFIRAGVYRETVSPKNSGTQSAPITYMPYNGESVTVSGADVIPASSWTLSSGNIYKAKLAWDLGEGANQVLLDGQMMVEARWPNTSLDISHPTVAHTSGGSFIDGGSGLSTGTITDPNLPSRTAGYWNGATLHAALGVSYRWQDCTVIDSPAGQPQLSFTFNRNGTLQVPGANNFYYLTGKLNELDSAGEWFLDSASSTLYFWTPASDSPAKHVVEVKHRQLAFFLDANSFITVQGLNLLAANISTSLNTQYLVLDGLNAQYLTHYSRFDSPIGLAAYYSGIILKGSNNVLRNSSIAWSAGSGVVVFDKGHRIFNNVIHDIDYTPDNAAPVYWTASPSRGSDGILIGWNTMYNTARAGIFLLPYFGKGRILHNEIHDVGL